MPQVVPVAHERAPRRGRYLVPLGTPRRAEVLAALGIATLLAGALFAQVTLVLAAVCHTVTKVSRLRPTWLLAPAAGGLVWVLAVGPAAAGTGFGSAPAAVTALLRRSFSGPLAVSQLAEVPGLVASRLAGQLPFALIAGSGVAAVLWWLDWLHTDEWDLVPAQPGLVCLARRAWHTWSIGSGGVVTRDGISLGVDAATGGLVALSWQQARAGVLLTGADPAAVAASGLQVVHAAVRRRQAVVVVDLAGSRVLAEAVAAVCAACGAPLRVYGPATRVSLGEVVRHRAVALFSLDTAGSPVAEAGHGQAAAAVVDRVTSDIAASYAGQHGALAPAGLVWVNGCEAAGPAALARLSAAGQQGPLGWVLGTTAPATAGILATRTGACVVHRVADPVLAGQLAGLGGSRLVPLGADPSGVSQPGGQTGAAGGFGAGGIGLGAVPVVAAESLCELGEGDFFLVARSVPGHTAGWAVRARAVAAGIPARPVVPHGGARPVVRSEWAG